MKKLVIIGARAFGREMYHLATQCKEYKKEWDIKGFLDDNKSVLNATDYPPGILSSVEDYKIEKGDVFICGLGSVAAKKKYVNIILEKGGDFINLVHPTSLINPFVTLGKGIIVGAFSNISNQSVIEDFVTNHVYTAIGHDCRIGKWSVLGACSYVAGNATLEEEVTLHPRVSILPKIRIGKGATIGAASVAIRNVKPGITVFGNPAVELKY